MKIFSLEINKTNILSIAFLTIVVLIIPFVYTHSTLDPALVPRHLALNLVLLIFGSVLLFILFKSSGYIDEKVFSRKIFIVSIAYLTVSGISMLFSFSQSEAIFEWFKTLTFFVLFCLLIIALLNDKTNYILVVKLILIYSILISLWGFYEIFTISSLRELDHQSSYFIRAFSSNRNLYSQILFLSLPFSLFGIYRLNTVWRILGIVSSVFIIILVTILLTRSVWIAFVASLLFSILILFLFRGSFNISTKGIKIISLSLFAGIVIVASGILLYSKFGGTEVFKKQTYWLSNYKYGSPLERIDLWENTIKMSLDNPVVGVGPGNWRIKFPDYGLENLRSETGEIFFQRPHNDFLWVWSENGILGLILYIILFCFVYYYLIQTIKKSPHLDKKYLALAMIFGLTGYLVISFFSFPKERIEHQIYLCIILAIAVTEYQILNPKAKPGKKGLLKFFSLVFLILMIVGSLITLSRFTSEQHIAKAYTYREKQNWQAEIEAYQNAETSITKVDAFSTPLSWYIGEAWYNMKNIDSAHYYFQKAYEINPYHLHVLNNLGTCFELKGKSVLAEAYYLKAHDIAPRFEDPLFNLCALYFNNKEYEKAFNTIRKIDVNTSNPKYNKFLNSILWYKVDGINKQISDRLIRKSVIRIRNSDDWMKKVYNQSIENEITFKKQLLIEVIYLLESVDSTLVPKEAKIYKEKYNLH